MKLIKVRKRSYPGCRIQNLMIVTLYQFLAAFGKIRCTEIFHIRTKRKLAEAFLPYVLFADSIGDLMPQALGTGTVLF